MTKAKEDKKTKTALSQSVLKDLLSATILDWENAAEKREEAANKAKQPYREGVGDGMARAYRSCADRLKGMIEEAGR